MELVKFRPVTPSLRSLTKLDRSFLSKRPLLKKCIKKIASKNGKNNLGQITVRHKGGGHKKKYRIINFNRSTTFFGMVCTIEYDPYRNSNIISLYELNDNKFCYLIAPQNIKIGDIIQSGQTVLPQLGNSLPLEQIPLGSYVHNVSMKSFARSQISRSAGTFSFLKAKLNDKVEIECSSGKTKILSSQCYATMGIVSNELFFLTKLGKAGRSRWLNKRPTVRGVAMNPVDHPHGGGEGKKSGKGKTFWGKPVKKGFIKR